MITEKHISKLLFEHDCVIVPGLGGFIANYSPASIHPVHHTFSPPSRTLAFNASLRNNDGLLATSIKTELGISFQEAIEIIHGDVSEIKAGINSGRYLMLKQIGTLSIDREKNIQFEPDTDMNYHADAFGLSTFTSPSIKRAGLQEKISRRLMPPQPVHSLRRLPSALKWAAVILPLASISIWSALHPEKINGLYDNYASLFPTKEKALEVRSSRNSSPESASVYKMHENRVATASIVPAFTETEKAVEIQPVAKNVYFIITGAFGVQENAETLVNDLKSQGYDASIAGQNSNGLYRVSIQGYSNKELAMQKVEEFRLGGFPGAWLLTMR